MDRAAKVAKARELRAAGWKYREIAGRLGISEACAYRYVNPSAAARKLESDRLYRAANLEARRAANREYQRTHKAECPQCGGEMGLDTARRGGKCEACHADAKGRRARQIEGWWAAGLPLKEIAANLGWSVPHLGVEMHRLRDAGYSLPYRRSVHNTPDRKPRFPEQVAA